MTLSFFRARPRRPGRARTAWPSLVLVAAVIAAGVTARAVPTATFRATTFEDLDRGEPRGTLISSEGEVLAGRSATRLKARAAMVWSTARLADGSVYFGTGDEGKVLGVRGNDVRVVADLKTVLVTALAAGPHGKLLAATMPDARVLEVDPASGKWRELARLPAAHVWALHYDARAARIYAASGSPGKIFSLPPNGGKPEVYFDPKEDHLLCLTADRNGALLAGSADRAVLYRVTGRNAGSAVHDFDATELRDVAVTAAGDIYVAANKFEVKTSGLPRFEPAKDGAEGRSIKPDSEAGGVKTSARPRPQDLRPGAKTGSGALYRLGADGTVDALMTLEKSYLTDLELDASGLLWAGDGTQGKVYLVRPDRTVLTAFDFPERQVLALAVSGETQYLGTGDAGAVYRVAPGPGAETAYLSQVFDAKFTARWGNLSYRATGPLRVEARSGNTAKPDATWSPWQAAAPRTGEAVVAPASPPAQYLQIRFSWPPPYSAALRSFTGYYLPRNQRARVTEIAFGDTEKETKEKSAERSPRVKIRWKSENPDGDTLVYRVFAREEMGVSWRLISGPDPLEKAEHEWDTEPVADGYYRIKVEVSDERSNPPETTLTASRVSERLLVDNRKPTVRGLAVRFPWVAGLAQDSYSPIQRIEYSLDGGEWRLIAPLDGIYDSPSEAFRFRLPEQVSPGRHSLAVRVLDEASNMGVSQASFMR